MDHNLLKLLVLMLCVSLAACTTLRKVPDWQPPVSGGVQSPGASALKAGDSITVTTTDGQKAIMRFRALTSNTLEGTAGRADEVVSIPRSQIARIERREVSALKTMGVVLLALLSLLIAAVSNMVVMPGP